MTRRSMPAGMAEYEKLARALVLLYSIYVLYIAFGGVLCQNSALEPPESSDRKDNSAVFARHMLTQRDCTSQRQCFTACVLVPLAYLAYSLWWSGCGLASLSKARAICVLLPSRLSGDGCRTVTIPAWFLASRDHQAQAVATRTRQMWSPC